MVPSKIQCFSFSIRHIPDNYSRTVYIIRQSRHHTLHIYVVNLCFINFTDIRHNKYNNHAFYRHFQSTHFSEKHKLSPETAMTLKNTRAKNDTLKPYTASKNYILKLSLPPSPVIFLRESRPWRDMKIAYVCCINY